MADETFTIVGIEDNAIEIPSIFSLAEVEEYLRPERQPPYLNGREDYGDLVDLCPAIVEEFWKRYNHFASMPDPVPHYSCDGTIIPGPYPSPREFSRMRVEEYLAGRTGASIGLAMCYGDLGGKYPQFKAERRIRLARAKNPNKGATC